MAKKNADGEPRVTKQEMIASAQEPKVTQKEMVQAAINDGLTKPKEIIPFIKAKYGVELAGSTISLYKGKILGTAGTSPRATATKTAGAPSWEQLKSIRAFADEMGGLAALAVGLREVADFIGELDSVKRAFSPPEEAAE